jgi:hypothetical protein
MTGLDPAIHVAKLPRCAPLEILEHKPGFAMNPPCTVLCSVDGRVKPGHDEAQRISPCAIALPCIA